MEATLGIVVVALLLGLLFLAGLLVVMGLVTLWLVKQGRSRALTAAMYLDDENSTMVPVGSPYAYGQPGHNLLVRDDPSSPGGPAPSLAAGGLIGFFDDEHSTTGIDTAHTELFQRGQVAHDWDDDEEEFQATEIFSAHGAAGDLAEFAFDDNDESTGRFSS